MKSCTWHTPKGLLLRAGLSTIPFALCQVLGLREYMTLLSGTLYAGSLTRCSLLCTAYLVSYAMVLILSPILILASGLLAGWGWVTRKTEQDD